MNAFSKIPDDGTDEPLLEQIEMPWGFRLRPADMQEKASDLMIERRPKAEIRGDVVRTIDDATGLAARRALRTGEPLRTADLTKPEIVQRNEAVTLVFEAPGMVLTIRGKALESGAEGDVISVLNAQSKRTVQGTITGPGQVTLSPPRFATRVEAANATGAPAPETSASPSSEQPRKE